MKLNEDAVVPPEGYLCGHPFAGSLWERTLEEIQVQEHWGANEWLVVLVLDRETQLFVSVHESLAPMLRTQRTRTELDDLTSLRDQGFLSFHTTCGIS